MRRVDPAASTLLNLGWRNNMPAIASAPKRKRVTSPHVPEQYRGFALQPTRMAMLLLQADEGSVVSMELIDDVGVESGDGTLLASQTKSARRTNPVADRSAALWKTFANWARDVRSGVLEPSRTIFELYVSRSVSGNFVARFHGVATKQQALSAFEEVREQLWGTLPTFAERAKVAGSLAPHLDELFGAGAEAFSAILPRFRLTCASKSPAMDLHDHLAKWLIVPEEIVQDLVCHLHGWLKERVDKQLETGRAPVIARDDFARELRAYYGRLRPSDALPDLARKPTPDELLDLLPFKFVRQLRLVELEGDSLVHAMTCYFKAVRVRTLWGDRALVHESSLDDLEEDLLQVWRNACTDVFSDPHRTDEALRGRLLHSRCDGHRVPGCFHALADGLRLGWHPRYATLLAEPAL
jgi:hypothetical protein